MRPTIIPPLWQKVSPTSRRPRREDRRRRHRPRLEFLENRLAPANVYWNVDADGFWDEGGKWSTGSPPQPGDDVFIDRPAGAFTVTHRSGTTTVNSLTSAEKFVLSGGSLNVTSLAQFVDVFTLQGGLLSNTSLQISGGSKLALTTSGGTLDSVTLNGDLDLTNYNVHATVTNGLTLNGTATLGASGSRLEFAGTQTLSGTGTVVFGNVSDTSVRLTQSATTLTIGPGITVRGGSNNVSGGRLGTRLNHPPTDVSIINQGTISADVAGTAINTTGQSFINQGILEANNGGHLNLTNLTGNLGTVTPITGSTLSLDGAYVVNQALTVSSGATLNLRGDWSNTGTLTSTDATVNLGGNFTVADLGTFNRNGGTVNVIGALYNSGTTLVLNAASGSWQLAGGAIRGGTVATSGGAKLILTNKDNSLEGVTIEGDLDLNTLGARAAVTDGLVLNGTATLGGSSSRLDFAGTQTLTGTGTVVFGNVGGNLLWLTQAGTTLTLGPGITVRGGLQQHRGWPPGHAAQLFTY